MTPNGPPHVEAYSKMSDSDFKAYTGIYGGLNVRIKRPEYKHIISALIMINDQKHEGYASIWVWLNSDKVILPMGIDLLFTDFECFNPIEDERSSLANRSLILNLFKDLP